MRWLAAILLVVLVILQYRLWIGRGSLAEVHDLKKEIAAEQAALVKLQARNEVLEAEVKDLHSGLEALEERARTDLGMIKQGETFLQIIEPRKVKKQP